MFLGNGKSELRDCSIENSGSFSQSGNNVSTQFGGTDASSAQTAAAATTPATAGTTPAAVTIPVAAATAVVTTATVDCAEDEKSADCSVSTRTLVDLKMTSSSTTLTDASRASQKTKTDASTEEVFETETRAEPSADGIVDLCESDDEADADGGGEAVDGGGEAVDGGGEAVVSDFEFQPGADQFAVCDKVYSAFFFLVTQAFEETAAIAQLVAFLKRPLSSNELHFIAASYGGGQKREVIKSHRSEGMQEKQEHVAGGRPKATKKRKFAEMDSETSEKATTSVSKRRK